MDEEMDTGVDTSDVGTTDVDTSSDVDSSDDVSSDIPEDIPEDDFSDSEEMSDDIPDDIEENNAEETEDYSDDIPEEDLDEDIPEDDSSDMEAESDETEDELTEDTETADEAMDDSSDESLANDLPEDTSDEESADIDSSSEMPDEIPEDVSDEETVQEAEEAPADTDTVEQPTDVQEDVGDEPPADEETETPVDTEEEQSDDAPRTQGRETGDYETKPETLGDNTFETIGEFAPASNPYASDEWDTLKDVPFASDETQTNPQNDINTGILDDSIVDTPPNTDANETAPANSVADYMNAHNYGREDFDTYSQDPEWRNLMRNEYPDYELPPLSQDSAFNQLKDYMNEHNYGMSDFDTYSQDPKWRELQSAAFPDYEMPPLRDAAEAVEINEGAFDAVPDNRREAIFDTFQEAPDEIKSTINDLSDELTVGDTRTYRDLDGSIKQECCHYSPSDDIIRMKPNFDNDEYAEVFRHEYGHFADAKLGDLSTKDDFVSAMNNDLASFENDTALKEQMLDDLASNSAIDDRCISDILSGSFNNDPDIIKRYESEFADYWQHPNDYWDGTNGPNNARERETFANMFSVYSGKGRDESIAFLEKYYPNTTKQFKIFFNK